MAHKRAKPEPALHEICYSDELPKLTHTEEVFLDSILNGLNNIEAVKLAFPNANYKPYQASIKGSQLKASANLSLWLTHSRKEGLIHHSVTYKGHLDELNRLKEGAIEAGQFGAAVKAEEIRGHVGGLRVEKVENVGVTGMQDAIKAIVDALGPKQGQLIARSLGFQVIEDVTPDK